MQNYQAKGGHLQRLSINAFWQGRWHTMIPIPLLPLHVPKNLFAHSLDLWETFLVKCVSG